MKKRVFWPLVITFTLILLSSLSLQKTYQWWFTVSQEEKTILQTYIDAHDPQDFITTFISQSSLNSNKALYAVTNKHIIMHGTEYPTVNDRDAAFDMITNVTIFTDIQGIDSNTIPILQSEMQTILSRMHQIKAYRDGSVKLGLDLQGGVLVRMKVMMSKDIHEQIFIKACKEQKIQPEDFDVQPPTIQKNINERVEEIRKRRLYQLRNDTMERILARVDEFGVSEPRVSGEEDDLIVVELPGLKNPDRVLKNLNLTGQLAFQIVDEQLSLMNDRSRDINEVLVYSNLQWYYDGELLPDDREVRYLVNNDKKTGNLTETPMVLYRDKKLKVRVLRDAAVQQGQLGGYEIRFALDAQTASEMFSLTSANMDKPMAIILDNNIKTAPYIRAAISDSGVISGDFTVERANDLSRILRAGALPADIKYLEIVNVGASLGEDSIRKGINAAAWGILVVILVMMFIYKIPGIISDITLMINMFIIFFIMMAFDFTLTLPGIAGLILTIGMAVDANVIIYERIKEELISGKDIRKAIDTGFKRSVTTILDANITTFITALIMMNVGTGPVKGFAVTLSVGIVSSVFAAFIVNRLFFNIILNNPNVRKMAF